MALANRSSSVVTHAEHRPHSAVGTAPGEDHIVRTSIDGEPEPEAEAKNMKLIVTLVYVALIAFGVGTGYLLAGKPSLAAGTSGTAGTATTTSATGEQVKKVAGLADADTFKDQATGVVKKGGLDGEGSHQLVRDGGPSQTVYLVSSAVDLDDYVDKTVTVWGQTIAAKKAPWLMDVGRLEVK